MFFFKFYSKCLNTVYQWPETFQYKKNISFHELTTYNFFRNSEHHNQR